MSKVSVNLDFQVIVHPGEADEGGSGARSPVFLAATAKAEPVRSCSNG